MLAKETHVDFAVLIEIKELLEEVSELLPLEWRQESLQFIDVGDVVGALGGEVGAHHRAHLARAFSGTALPPITGGRLGGDQNV